MLTADLCRFLRSDFKKLRLVWFLFLAAAAACYLVVRLTGADWGAADGRSSGLAPAFYVSAVVLAASSLFRLRAAFTDERMTGLQSRGAVSGMPPAAGFTRRDGYEDLDGYNRSLLAVFVHARSSYVVAWIMQVAVAVLGLLLAFSTRRASDDLVFVIAALALLVIARPQATRHLERAARLS